VKVDVDVGEDDTIVTEIVLFQGDRTQSQE
jgi:hypothetical protein